MRRGGWGGGGGGGGGVGLLFNGASGKLKGPQAVEESQGRLFATEGKVSLLFRKFCPAAAFLLQNKNKNKIKK